MKRFTENRTTHNLAATLSEIAARLNNKIDTIASNVELVGEENPAIAKDPAPTAVNEILDRTMSSLLRLENRLDLVHDNIGSVYTPDPSAKATSTAYIGGQARR